MQCHAPLDHHLAPSCWPASLATSRSAAPGHAERGRGSDGERHRSGRSMRSRMRSKSSSDFRVSARLSRLSAYRSSPPPPQCAPFQPSPASALTAPARMPLSQARCACPVGVWSSCAAGVDTPCATQACASSPPCEQGHVPDHSSPPTHTNASALSISLSLTHTHASRLGVAMGRGRGA